MPGKDSQDDHRDASAPSRGAEAAGTAVLPRLTAGRGADSGWLARTARRYLAARRVRTQIAQGSMFSDPAWDMLLDLFAARLEGGRVSVTSACLASGAAPSTALDWITKLEQMGLLARLPDPKDRRRTYLEISQEAADAVAHWLATAFAGDAAS